MKGDDLEHNQIFTRRAFMLATGQVGLMAVLTGRLYYMQILQSDRYQTLSEKNRISIIPLYPARGNIVDRNEKLIAISMDYFRIILDRRENPKYRTSIEYYFDLFKIDPEQQVKILSKLASSSIRVPVVLKEDISWSEISLVEENLLSLPGIYVESIKVRKYPYSYPLSHLLGYVGPMNEKEKKHNPSVPDIEIGKAGLEKFHDKYLRGSFGSKRMEVNAHGLYIRKVSEYKASIGQKLDLTIDSEVQADIYEKLSRYPGGAAIAIDVTNGNILTLISAPGFDSNKFTGKISEDDWNELIRDPYKPLINRAISNTYPPGSIFKLIVLLAALENGVSPDYAVHCSGHVIVGSRRFRCWYKQGHGTLNMREAIKHSCNSYMYNVSKIIGSDAIIEMAKKFGFSTPSNIDLPGEINGFVPTKEWKISRFGHSWQTGDTANTSIGQGYTQVTPMQLAIMASIIASGGKVYKPNLLMNNSAQLQRVIDVKPENIEIIREGMLRVMKSPGGTAFMSQILDDKYTICGKTGTSQVVSKRDDNRNLSVASVHWSQRNHALFIGYGPYHNPRFACSVVVDHGGSGSRDAAPIGRDLLSELMRKYI